MAIELHEAHEAYFRKGVGSCTLEELFEVVDGINPRMRDAAFQWVYIWVAKPKSDLSTQDVASGKYDHDTIADHMTAVNWPTFKRACLALRSQLFDSWLVVAVLDSILNKLWQRADRDYWSKVIADRFAGQNEWLARLASSTDDREREALRGLLETCPPEESEAEYSTNVAIYNYFCESVVKPLTPAPAS